MDEGRFTPDRLVTALHETATDLLAVLGEEQRALAGSDAADLDALFERKATLGDALDKLETRRRATWTDDTHVFTAALNAASRSTWDSYLDALAQCREANAVNGRLVQYRQRHVMDALMLLRGATGNAQDTYSASGTRTDGLDPVSLGTA